MRHISFKSLTIFALGTSLAFISCSKDEDDENVNPATTQNGNGSSFSLNSQVDALGTVSLPNNFSVPNVYDVTQGGAFYPGAYKGQKRRVAQLQEIADSSRNEPINWDIRAALENSNRNSFQSADAQGDSDLRTKIDELNYDNGNTAIADRFAELADSLVMSSKNYATTASNGVAGMITTGSKRRHVSAKGLEYIQMLEKGLYGALLYDQMVDDYLSASQSGDQNPGGNHEGDPDYSTEGTARQHAFDEAFGYLAVDPLTYPNASNSSNGDGKFIANYTFDFSDEIEAEFGVNPAQKLMDAFIFGRSVLKAGQGLGPSGEQIDESHLNAAIADIKLYTEIGLACAAYHYLNDAIKDVTDEDKVHHLSEALAFIYALSFNSEGLLSESQAHNALIELGWSSTDPSLSGVYEVNLWEVSDTQMESAKSILNQAYPGFGNIDL
ncbi:MAG: DUF4856 domain-containing protein [Vicingaceae bacterium]